MEIFVRLLKIDVLHHYSLYFLQSISEFEPVASQLVEKQTEFGNKQKHIEERTAEIKVRNYIV